MHAAPQFARMVDERGVEVQQDYASLTSASELLPLNGKSDPAPVQRLNLRQQQCEGAFVQQSAHVPASPRASTKYEADDLLVLQDLHSEAFGHLPFCLALFCLPLDL